LGEIRRTMLAFDARRARPVIQVLDPLKPSPRKEALEQREACELQPGGRIHPNHPQGEKIGAKGGI
jgi:hypothetical protein